MSATIRLSGYPAAAPVSLQVAGVNAVGTGPLSVAKSATPGAAAGAAPALWGSIAHGAELSAASLDVSAWALDGATETALDAAAPYTAPRRVTGDQVWHRKNTTTAALTVGVGYPFAAIVKPGTSNAARIVVREAGGGEARVLTTGFAAVTVAYSAAAPGTITGAAVEVLADGFVRLSGVFTPGIATTYSFGVGPNPASGVSGNVDVYGGALAEPEASPPPPEPEPETVPTPFAPEQWELLDAGTNGTTLIVRILELPYDGGRPLTFIGYRLNGSAASIGFPAIAPGDYQITVPSLTEASVLLRAANALGGVSSAPKVATPTATAAPDPGPSDFAVAANGYLEQHYAINVGVPVAASDPANSGTWGGEKPVNTTGYNKLTRIAGNTLPLHGFGKAYLLGSGAIVYANAIGDLIFHPNGAYDSLNPGENAIVDLTYRQNGDVADKHVTIRVTGSTAVGPDLARGVTPGASMTLISSVAAGEVLEVAFTAAGSAVTPSFGGATGKSCPAGRRDVQYLRPTSASTALTFAGGTVSNVIAKVVQTPGDAASIRKLTASRSGSTLSLAWDTTTRAGLPATSGAVTTGPTTVTNGGTVRTINLTPTTDYFMDRVTMIDSGRMVRAGSLRNLTVLDCVRDGTSATFSIREGAGTLVLGVNSQWSPVFLGPIHVQNLYSDLDIRTYPNMDNVNVTIGGKSIRSLNNDTVDLDGPADNLFSDPWGNDIRFINVDSRNTGDAHFDCKAPAQIFACSMGEGALLGQTSKDGPSDGVTYGGWRGIRNWRLTTTASRCYVARKARDIELWIGSPYAFTQLWMYQIEGGKVRAHEDITGVGFDTRGGWESGWGSLWDGRMAGEWVNPQTSIAQPFQILVKHTKPDLKPAADYAATDFEFEQSLNGGASWSPLAVERTGPNDCWGATRRTITGVSTSITHVRARARWGAKVGAWTQTGVTI